MGKLINVDDFNKADEHKMNIQITYSEYALILGCVKAVTGDMHKVAKRKQVRNNADFNALLVRYDSLLTHLSEHASDFEKLFAGK